jgi:hypothetical protein
LEKHLFADSEISPVLVWTLEMEKDAFAFLLDFYFLGKVVAAETAVRCRFTDSKILSMENVFCFASFVVGVYGATGKVTKTFPKPTKTLGDWDQHLPNTELSLILTVCIKGCAVSSCPKASLSICLQCIFF